MELNTKEDIINFKKMFKMIINLNNEEENKMEKHKDRLKETRNLIKLLTTIKEMDGLRSVVNKSSHKEELNRLLIELKRIEKELIVREEVLKTLQKDKKDNKEDNKEDNKDNESTVLSKSLNFKNRGEMIDYSDRFFDVSNKCKSNLEVFDYFFKDCNMQLKRDIHNFAIFMIMQHEVKK